MFFIVQEAMKNKRFLRAGASKKKSLRKMQTFVETPYARALESLPSAIKVLKTAEKATTTTDDDHMISHCFGWGGGMIDLVSQAQRKEGITRPARALHDPTRTFFSPSFFLPPNLLHPHLFSLSPSFSPSALLLGSCFIFFRCSSHLLCSPLCYLPPTAVLVVTQI